MVKYSLIDDDKERDNKYVILKQVNQIMTLCVNDTEKTTQKMISELCENDVLSAVGCEEGTDNDKEKIFFNRKIVKTS